MRSPGSESRPDLASKYDELGAIANTKLAGDFDRFGMELSRFYIENICAPGGSGSGHRSISKLGVMATNFRSTRRLKRPKPSRSPPPTRVGSPARVPASVPASRSVRRWGRRWPEEQLHRRRWQRQARAGRSSSMARLTVRSDDARAMVASGQVSPAAQVWRQAQQMGASQRISGVRRNAAATAISDKIVAID